MTMGFLIFYKYKPMTTGEARRAAEEWEKFKAKNEAGKVISEYDHAYGTEWNGFFLVETEDMASFEDFWKEFRNSTRWYVESTQAIIGRKR